MLSRRSWTSFVAPASIVLPNLSRPFYIKCATTELTSTNDRSFGLTSSKTKPVDISRAFQNELIAWNDFQFGEFEDDIVS